MSEAIQIAVADDPPQTMSYEAFIDWEHRGIAEWVQGEVFEMSVKREHQRVVEFLDRVLGLFVRIFKLGEVYLAPYVMIVKAGVSAREPDLMFVAAANVSRATSKGLEGPADLVIEVVSEESVTRDKIDKFEEYEDTGVSEYWIIDSRPGRQRADFYVLDERNRYRAVPADDAGIYRSTALSGFWIKVDWLFEADPNPLKALAEIVGRDRLLASL